VPDPNNPGLTDWTTNPVAGDKVLFTVPVFNYSVRPISNMPSSFYAVPVEEDEHGLLMPVRPATKNWRDHHRSNHSAKWTPHRHPARAVDGGEVARTPGQSGLADFRRAQRERRYCRRDPSVEGRGGLPQGFARHRGGAEHRCRRPHDRLDDRKTHRTLLRSEQSGLRPGHRGKCLFRPHPGRCIDGAGLVQAASPDIANVRFSGVGIVTGEPKHLRLDPGEQAVLQQGSTGTIVGCVAGDRDSVEHQMVLAYDGEPGQDDLIAAASLQGIAAESGRDGAVDDQS